LAQEKSWFADVLRDPQLTIGIRDDYINVYADGQSLFKATWNKISQSISITTHPKYLVDPSLKEPVRFDGQAFEVSSIEPLVRTYEYGSTLGRMKKAANLYSGVEKTGVQQIVRANKCVIDLEIALSKESEQEMADDAPNPRATAKKLDIAALEKVGSSIHLCFWEAKHYTNAELWASGTTLPPVVKQVLGYNRLIEEYRNDILTSYRLVAQNLVEIARMAGRYDELSPLINEVAADGTKFDLASPASVGVVVFGFSAADKASDRHKSMKRKLVAEGLTVYLKGSARDFSLDPSRTECVRGFI
jgi:hypothetical protein